MRFEKMWSGSSFIKSAILRTRRTAVRQRIRALRCESLERRDLLAVVLDAAMNLGGSGDELGADIATDSAGNTYLSGVTLNSPTVDFDPANIHPNDADIVGSGPQPFRLFVAKYDAGGAFQWVQSWTAGYFLARTELDVDVSGNVYVTSEYQGTLNANNTLHTAIGNSDAIVLAVDPAGQMRWSHSVNAASSDQVPQIAVTPSGSNAYVATFTSNTTGTTIITKLVPSGATAHVAWSRQITVPAGSAQPTEIAVDPSGNVVTVGVFRGTADFDPGNNTVNLSSGGDKKSPASAAYVWKLNSGGGLVWARHFAVPKSGGSSTAHDMTIDSDGAIHVTGSFRGAVDFNPASPVLTLSSAGGSDAYWAKLNAAGALAAARSYGTATDDDSRGIALDSDGTVFLAGLRGSGGSVQRLDSNGNVQWSAAFGTPQSLVSLAIERVSNQVQVVGSYSASSLNVDSPDPDPSQPELLNAGAWDLFWLTFDQS